MGWRTKACEVGLTLAFAATAACKPKVPDPPEPAAEEASVKLVVRAEKHSNGGRPLYLLLRVTTQKSFVEDDYAMVAKLVIAPDATVVERLVVFPGQPYVVNVKVPKLPATIGVYGFFTKATGESWKLLFDGQNVIELVIGTAMLERRGPATGD